MKFLSFLLCAVLILSFTVNSFAIDMESPEVEPAGDETVVEFTQPENEYLNMVLDGMQSDIDTLNEKVEVLEDDVSAINESNAVSNSPVEDVTTEEPEEINPDTDLPVSVELLSVAPITPSDTSGLKAVLLSVIGDYDPVIVEYEYQNSNNYSSYLREVLPDYPWCASFLMLALFVYCIFRLGGALIG
ncbi:MAG: hypothetical protein IKK14_05900 [Oscillospiraceae bacterium]|nr:hypothetical protein [Oscillospiraceae bacterium]